MANWVVIAASTLAAVWLIETLLFVVSYRTSQRSPASGGDFEAPLSG